ncbi:ATPase, T2SS/T4P/T4SS family [Anatilimnocola floriformis]|uniref:ATPase, T2SS/T4P/T4SS family n=1 Tax=Anatilimnocola floriformis TaxID=2948575 RepID=UPI0020C364BF|nr:ATPase, T2SS/T4P/T4SS family [Anatilimnocola floriformis]
MTMTASAPRQLPELREESMNFQSNPLEAGGIGALTANGRNLPLRRLAIRSRVSGVNVQTMVAQVFANPQREFVEATYIFPLPGRFAVTACTMHVGGRTIEAELQERGQARATYDKAIAAGHRASIAEEERSETFTLRVGNIPHNEEVSVELTLVGNITVDHGEGTLRLPLVVAPRYVPGQALDGPSVGAGTANDTDEVPDASRVTPPVLLAGLPNPVNLSIEVELDPGAAAHDPNWRNAIRSSLHSVFVNETTPVKIKLHPGERLNRDFILRFPVLPLAAQGSAEFATGKNKQPGTFAVTIFPPADCAAKQLPRDVVFVLDRSGSMEGWKIVAARRALARMIDTLRGDDRFRVLAFDDTITTPHAKGASFQIADDRQRWQAAEWIAKIESGGGTELGGALRAALQPFATFGMPEGRDAVVVLITDGQVAGEDSVLRTIEALRLPRMPRIFTLGIDRSVNASLLTRLANLGGGAFELIESEQRLDEVLERVHTQIAPPVLTNVTIESLDGDLVESTITPANNHHVFADRPLTILGRCGADPKALRLRITAHDASGGTWRQEITAERTNSPMLLPLWGRGRVRELEDQYAKSSDQKLQTQIVATSLESHILSRFTAYVAVDRAEVVNKGGVLEQIIQPVEQPEGWAMPVACAAPAPARAMMMRAPTGAQPAAGKTRGRKKSSGFLGFFQRTEPVDLTQHTDGMQDDAAKSASPGSSEDQCFRHDDDADSVDSKLQEFTDTELGFCETSANTVPTLESLIENFPRSLAREHQLLPVTEKDGKLVVRMANPSDRDAIEILRFILNREIEVESNPIQDFEEEFKRVFPQDGDNEPGSTLVEFCSPAYDFDESDNTTLTGTLDENSSKVVRTIQLVIQEAAQLNVSHITLQPDGTGLAVHYLFDGTLRCRDYLPQQMCSAIADRICTLAKIKDRSERLKCGQIKVTVGEHDFDLRVIFIPTVAGMAIVIRIRRNPAQPADANWPQLLAPWLEAAAAADPAQAPAVFAVLCGD